MTSRRERAVWAAVFSVPPAVGMALATAKVGPRTVAAPVVAGVFVVVVVAMVVLVYGAAAVGSEGEAVDPADAE